MRGALKYSGVTVAVAGTLAAAGAMLGAGRGVAFGAAVACTAQLLFFWTLAVRADPSRRLIAYGAGALGRLLVIGAAALLLAPRLGMAAAAPLLAMVAVFFLTTLLEPMLVTEPKAQEVR